VLSWLGDELPRCALLAAERQYYCQVKPRLADEARARESEAAGMVNERNRVSSLRHARVSDCTHVGILSCASDAPLARVAGIMAERIDVVAVTDHEGAWPVGVVSDLDVVAAAVGGTGPSALQAAANEPLAVSADESLQCAARLMAEHGVAHLVVLDAASGYPVGVLSTLDIAAAYAGVAG
jgi:CBS domain-containing protein